MRYPDGLSIILSLKPKPHHHHITQTKVSKMPKAQRKTSEEAEEIGPSAVINPDEAREHVKDLEALMSNVEEMVKTGNTVNLLKETLNNMKTQLTPTIPTMETAEVDIILQAIKDKNFHILSPRTETGEKLLEELLPSDDIPSASGVIQTVQEADTLSRKDQELIAELFDSLETAYDQLATASGLLGRLSHTLKPPQLILLLKASIQPLIHLRTAAGTELESFTGAPAQLPDDQDERIEIMLFPDQNAPLLKKENINSPSRLLAATYAFKIINKFGKGVTQRGLQERYRVKAKQLAMCINGRKYWGRTDKKSIVRK